MLHNRVTIPLQIWEQGQPLANIDCKMLTSAIILDDKKARRLAHRPGLEFKGTAAALLEGRLRELLTTEEFLKSLKELGKVMWLSPEVIAELLSRAKVVGK